MPARFLKVQSTEIPGKWGFHIGKRHHPLGYIHMPVYLLFWSADSQGSLCPVVFQITKCHDGQDSKRDPTILEGNPLQLKPVVVGFLSPTLSNTSLRCLFPAARVDGSPATTGLDSSATLLLPLPLSREYLDLTRS